FESWSRSPAERKQSPLFVTGRRVSGLLAVIIGRRRAIIIIVVIIIVVPAARVARAPRQQRAGVVIAIDRAGVARAPRHRGAGALRNLAGQHDPGVGHLLLLDQREQRGGVGGRYSHAAVRGRPAEALVIGAVDGVALL